MIGELLLDYLIAAADDSPSWMQDITGGVFDRRTLFKRGFTALTLLRATRASASTAPDSTSALDDITYAEWYAQVSRNAEGDQFEHPDYHKTSDVSSSIREIIRKKITDSRDFDFLREDGWYNARNILDEDSVRYSKRQLFTGIRWGEKELREFTERSNAALREFFEYAGISSLCPNISTYNILDPSERVALSGSSGVVPNIVWHRSTSYTGEYKVHKEYPGSRYSPVFPEDKWVNITLTERTDHSEIPRRYEFDMAPGNRVILPTIHVEPIVLTIGVNAASAYSTTLQGVMHYAMITASGRDMKNQLQKSVDYGNDINVDGTQRRIIQDRVTVREEAIVHGLFYEFANQKLVDLGLAPPDSQQMFGNNLEDPKYALVPFIIHKAREMGPVKVMRLYLHNPDALFSG